MSSVKCSKQYSPLSWLWQTKSTLWNVDLIFLLRFMNLFIYLIWMMTNCILVIISKLDKCLHPLTVLCEYHAHKKYPYWMWRTFHIQKKYVHMCINLNISYNKFLIFYKVTRLIFLSQSCFDTEMLNTYSMYTCMYVF